jgi:hypothetical protein
MTLVTGARRSALRERGDDLYESPPEAVEALLRIEKLPRRIWEPACGPGAIVRVLRHHGHDVVATDLVNYKSEDSKSRVDFLMERQAPAGVQAIVTNPPFKLATEFVEHALELCPIVVMLLRLNFMESKRRARILDGGKLARLYSFSNRLPMMHRAGWTGKRASSAVAFAWYVWDCAHSGPYIGQRIAWQPATHETSNNRGGGMNMATACTYLCPRLLPDERVAARRAMVLTGQMRADDSFVVFAVPSEADSSARCCAAGNAASRRWTAAAL